MRPAKLTNRAQQAHNTPMDWGRKARAATMMMLGSALAAGCITVNAPSEPIVIELNINIKQEVIYRLAADAGNTIEQNEDIF